MFVLMSFSCLLFSADTGIITGRVKDEETGKPLIGAEVYLQRTELGAATDQNGEYFIFYVPAGTYKVIAAYIGYHEFTYDSVSVNAEDTIYLNFRLQPSRPLIHWHVPSLSIPYGKTQNISHLFFTGNYYRSSTNHEGIAHWPFTTIDQLLTLQPSIVQSDSGLHLRGGKYNDIVYYLDDMEIRVPNLGIQPALIAPSCIDKLSIIKGALNAEYGNALSGIVNITTKQGGVKHHGNLHYLTDEVFSRGKLNCGYNKYDFSLGGPIMKRLRYFISSELMLTDAYQKALYQVTSPRNDYRTQARITYLFPNARGRISISGFKSREQHMLWKPSGSDTLSELIYLFDPPMQRSKTWIASAKFGYMLNSKTLINFLVGTTHFDRVYGSRDSIWEDQHDKKWFNDYRLKNEHFIAYLLSDTVPVRDILLDSMDFNEASSRSFHKDPYGIKGLFTYVEEFPAWSFWHNNNIQIRGDVVRCIGKYHETKTGFDLVRYDIRYYNREVPPCGRSLYDFRYYHRNPYKLAGYLQDKINLVGVIANLGIRFDLFNANTFTYCFPLDFWDDTLANSKAIVSISPRFGVSLPVTERMRFRFAYGHYYQIPPFDYMYNTSDTAVIRLLLSNGENVFSNISLKPEKLVVYEIGFEKIYRGNILFSFNAYYKNYDNLLQLRKVQALPDPYFQYFNDGHSTVKGIELMVKKRLPKTINFGIAYTLQYAKGASAWAHADYYTSDIEPPVINYWLDHDERHNILANIDFVIPKDFSLSPFRNLTNSIIFSYHSGHPYTPEDLTGERLANVNTLRMPDYWNVDWKINRRLHIGPAKFVLSCLINNLFNTEQIIEVYPITGKPDDHGDPVPSLDQFDYVPITSSYYSPQADYDHDGLITPPEFQFAYATAVNDYYNNPTYYNNGFRMKLGIGVDF
jgi:outer membrane receptor protein involved in Fe transport